VERSALVEAAEQFTRALAQVMSLPATPKLRREQIKLQVALISPLMQIKGYAAPETKAAVERARLLIDQSEALGEPPDDALLLFSVLYGFWVANYVAFNGRTIRELADEFLAVAEKQEAAMPLVVGNRLVGTSLASTGQIMRGRVHLDRAVALYDPAKHRPLGMRFGQDIRVATLSYRAMVLWMLGYPKAALADIEQMLTDAREINQAATSMYASNHALLVHLMRGDYAEVERLAERQTRLAEEKGVMLWKAGAMLSKGCVFALTSNSDANQKRAIETLNDGLSTWSSTGATVWGPWYRAHLAKAHAQVGQFDEAWRHVREAMTAIESSKEAWWEVEVNRIAGEIARRSPGVDLDAEKKFERALAVARQQQAKSWELRASMSLARLWRSQGKVQQARELLAPVYGWFTEGFNTRDLKEAKALLEELAS
jgi:predicted ATPase